MTMQITRLEHNADAMRQHAGHVNAAPVARRLLASALVLEGHGQADAARSCGMDRQTLRDWGIRYNEHGIAGLSDLPKRGGAAPKLPVEEKAAQGKPIELWWHDEARIGQQGSLTRIWAKRGCRAAAPRDQRYQSAYLFGAVCPSRGVGASLVLPHANAHAMNLHLQEISTQVSPGALRTQ